MTSSHRSSSRVGAPTDDGVSIMGNVFRVNPRRYKDLKAIGKGSYGVVCSAADVKRRKKVAIKKITPMAQYAADAKHVLREIRLMRYLGVHPNIITLEDVFVREMHDELYIVMELLDSDLHRIIQSPQALSDAHHRYFMYQLLRGVQFLHDNRIIHRDLKPGNLLVTKNCQLKITDFGLARARPTGAGPDPDDSVDEPMTEHVVTRWYRPPELMLCPDGLYTYAVDMWSVGCIFAELLGRQPLFPGKNFVDQLTLIFDVVGSPRQEEVAHIRNSQALKFLDSMIGKPRVPCRHLFPHASELAIALLDRLLVFHPPLRLTVAEALDHPYFEPLRNTDTRKDPIVSANLEFEFEMQEMSRLPLKSLIIQEVTSFRCEQHRKDQERAALADAQLDANGGARDGSGNGSVTASNGNGNVDYHNGRPRSNSDESAASTGTAATSASAGTVAARAGVLPHASAAAGAPGQTRNAGPEAATVKAGAGARNGGWRANGGGARQEIGGQYQQMAGNANGAAPMMANEMDQDSPVPRSSSSSEAEMQPISPGGVGVSHSLANAAAAEEAAAAAVSAAAARARRRTATEHGSADAMAMAAPYCGNGDRGIAAAGDANNGNNGLGNGGNGLGNGGNGVGNGRRAALHGATAAEADIASLRMLEARREALAAASIACAAPVTGVGAADGAAAGGGDGNSFGGGMEEMIQSPPLPATCDSEALRELEGSMDRLRMHKPNGGTGLAAYWRGLRR